MRCSKKYIFFPLTVIRMIKSRRMRWTWYVERVGMSFVQKILVVKPEAKRPLGRPRRRWEDSIYMGRTEIVEGWEVWTGFIWLKMGYMGGLL
jgi:hypothetical protein